MIGPLRFYLFLSLILTSFDAFSKAKISSIQYAPMGNNGRIIINYSGQLNNFPELNFGPQMIQVVMGGASIWPKINKTVPLNTSGQDLKIMGYQYDKAISRVRAYLPFPVEQIKGQVNVQNNSGQLIVNFPIPRANVSKVQKKRNSQSYDEQYLDKLLAEKKKTDSPKKDFKSFFGEEKVKDKVKVTQSSIEKKQKSGFDITNYLGKFIAFLGLLVVGLYIVVLAMKKGFVKKGRLGFLHNSQMLKVINTTHISPKRSLMIVDVGQELFLIGSSENGLNLISKIEDREKVLKTEEFRITGSNFDTQLANDPEKAEIKLKEDINKSSDKPESVTSKLKEKMKSLKPLH